MIGKKGQFARAVRRELNTADRNKRLLRTCLLRNEGLSTNKIAVELGVSASTVKEYLNEINSNPKHFERILTELRDRPIKRQIWWTIVGWSFLTSFFAFSLFTLIIPDNSLVWLLTLSVCFVGSMFFHKGWVKKRFENTKGKSLLRVYP